MLVMLAESNGRIAILLPFIKFIPFNLTYFKYYLYICRKYNYKRYAKWTDKE